MMLLLLLLAFVNAQPVLFGLRALYGIAQVDPTGGINLREILRGQTADFETACADPVRGIYYTIGYNISSRLLNLVSYNTNTQAISFFGYAFPS